MNAVCNILQQLFRVWGGRLTARIDSWQKILMIIFGVGFIPQLEVLYQLSASSVDYKAINVNGEVQYIVQGSWVRCDCFSIVE
jgi:hypothetical protein